MNVEKRSHSLVNLLDNYIYCAGGYNKFKFYLNTV